MKKATIKYRLIAIALVFNVISLSALSGIGLFWYRSEQLRNLDTFLQTDSQGMVDTIGSFLETELYGIPDISLSAAIKTALESPKFTAILRDAAQTHRDTPQIYKTTTAIFDKRGKRIFISNNALPIDFPSMESLTAFENAKKHAESGTMTIDAGNDVEFRTVSVPVYFRKIPVAMVQESSMVDSVNGPVDSLRDLLLIGLPLFWLLSGIAMFAMLERAFRPVNDIVATIHRITGTDLKIRVPLPPSDDEIRHLAETFNDMLNRVDAAFDFQARLAQDLSHQLRTPLSVLKGTLETGLRRVRSTDEYQEILESNLEEVNRIGRLIESILLLARLDSKAAPIQNMEVDLFALVDGLRSDLSPLWEQKNLRIEINYDETIFLNKKVIVRGDTARLRQVFLNMLDNAWKYCPENGLIRIDFVHSEKWTTTILYNEGVSIPESERERIFERFYRAPSESGNMEGTARTPGFGLGLSIARSIVELHGGRIYVGDSDGKGTAFFVELPNTSRDTAFNK